MLLCLCSLYHQAVTTGLQSAETDAEQDRSGEGVVVDEATALGVTVVTIQGQICVGVAGEEHGAEVNLQSDGLNAAVHTDVPLSWSKREEERWGKDLAISFWLCCESSGLQSQRFHKRHLLLFFKCFMIIIQTVHQFIDKRNVSK